MEVDGYAEVTASLAEQADKAADATVETAALDPHTGRVRVFAHLPLQAQWHSSTLL